MGTYLAIDPGKRSLGWAVFNVFHALSPVPMLFCCGLVRCSVDPFEEGVPVLLRGLRNSLGHVHCAGYCVDRVVVELPRVYPRSRGQNINDLIDLAAVAGACMALGPARFVHPRTWKGAVPKGISHERIRAALSLAEQKVLEAGLGGVVTSLRHNVLDAVGIGLWWRQYGEK